MSGLAPRRPGDLVAHDERNHADQVCPTRPCPVVRAGNSDPALAAPPHGLGTRKNLRVLSFVTLVRALGRGGPNPRSGRSALMPTTRFVRVHGLGSWIVKARRPRVTIVPEVSRRPIRRAPALAAP